MLHVSTTSKLSGMSVYSSVSGLQLHVAFCSDLTLRVFSEHFELIQVVHITATVLRYTVHTDTLDFFFYDNLAVEHGYTE